MLKADKGCPECHGLGYVPDGPTDYKKCVCLLRNHANQYLGPYREAEVPYLDPMGNVGKAEDFIGRNLVFVDPLLDRFKSFVKHFLIQTDLKYTHDTVTAYDVAQVYYADQGTVRALVKLDILIIMLNAGPSNASYGNLLEGLIKERLWKDKPTWVNSRYELKSEQFVKEYQDLGQVLGHSPFCAPMRLRRPKLIETI